MVQRLTKPWVLCTWNGSVTPAIDAVAAEISAHARDPDAAQRTALALGSAGASFADRLSDVVIQMLAQHIGRNPFGGESGSEVGLADVVSAPCFLNFGSGAL